ncbi:glycosyltransferase family 4 protein [Sciscionella marina]|uniref:glycosyltransferase family 4 protein n=1 Tax=Sciscionella marina TaxID=508770 RepID=UPI0003638262|nr:MraY family glycosyltransferase [Sciscionella marina]
MNAGGFGLGVPVKEFTLVALTTAVVTLLLTGLVRLLAFKIGAVAVPRARDVHAKPMPRMGGVAMYGGVCAGMLLAHQLPVLRRAFDYALDPEAVLVGGGLIVLVGMLDDRFELDSLTKAAGQIAAAGVLVLFGVQWLMFWVPWGGTGHGSVLVLDQNMGGVLVILLTFALVNALNFVDGLDGLAAGIGLIAAVATGAFALVLLAKNGGDVSSYPPALIAATLAGACLGFLPHNFQPAKIFMGDSGSMLIGLMLAAAATSASGRVNYLTFGAGDAVGLLSPLIVVVAVLLIPLLDLIMAVIRRVRNGTSWAKPDKMHLHHRLLEVGHSQRRAVLLIYLWAGVLAFGAVALTVFDVFLVAGLMVVCLLIALLVSAIPRLRASRGRHSA